MLVRVMSTDEAASRRLLPSLFEGHPPQRLPRVRSGQRSDRQIARASELRDNPFSSRKPASQSSTDRLSSSGSKRRRSPQTSPDQSPGGRERAGTRSQRSRHRDASRSSVRRSVSNRPQLIAMDTSSDSAAPSQESGQRTPVRSSSKKKHSKDHMIGETPSIKLIKQELIGKWS